MKYITITLKLGVAKIIHTHTQRNKMKTFGLKKKNAHFLQEILKQ